MRKAVHVLLLLLVFGILGGAAQAAVITYTATDLVDVMPGEDLWRYDYLVDRPFAVDEGVAIYFERTNTGTISAPVPDTNPPGWDIIYFQHDFQLPADGAFDALALSAQPGPTAFAANFVRTAGTPGPQRFEIYVLDASENIEILERGFTQTASIPEPATALLLSAAAIGWQSRRRRVARRDRVERPRATPWRSRGASREEPRGSRLAALQPRQCRFQQTKVTTRVAFRVE